MSAARLASIADPAHDGPPLPVGLAASLGGLAGTWLGKRVDAKALRRAFAVLLLAGSAVQLAGSVFLG